VVISCEDPRPPICCSRAPRRPFVNQLARPSPHTILPPLMASDASPGVAHVVKSPPCRAMGRGQHANGGHPPPQSSVLPLAAPCPTS
ncbi:hypothetical protein GALMADRAFT_250190, partial [Galerina marginata CBS 339.88]